MAQTNDDIFDELNKRVSSMGRGMASNRANSLAQVFAQSNEYSVNQKGGNVRLRSQQEQQESGDQVIDLKEQFKRSPKRKRSKDGGWYLVVPIRLYTSRSRHRESSGMSSRLYKDLNSRAMEEGQNSRNIVSDYLYDNRKGNTSATKELQYTPRSNNITKMKNNSMTGRGNKYVAFRTVSDKSHPSSWIVNRQKSNPFDQDDETKRIMDAVKKYNRKANRGLVR